MKKLLLLGFFMSLMAFLNAQTKAPTNPRFLEFVTNQTSNSFSADGHPLGEIPLVERPYFNGRSSVENHSMNALTDSYDLRDENLVTPVKDQIISGPCWAFGTIGSIESNWLKNGYGTLDLSEKNMSGLHGFEWEECDGGNMKLAAAYLTRISGPISEADDTYPSSPSCPVDWSGGTGYSSVAQVTSAVFLPGSEDAGFDPLVIKQAIVDYGAIYTNMFYDQLSSTYPNTHYYTGSEGTNHGVLLVGWDNDKVTDASSNGAWIIKNSWGASWGEDGYFYVSYEDTEILTSVAYYPTRINTDASSELYLYDQLGNVSSFGWSDDTDYGLIKFTASANQKITSLSTSVNTEATVISFDVYDDFDGTNLTNLLGSISDQTCDYPGYYTFDLAAAITINSGNDFYIKVKYNTPGNNYSIPVEKVSEGYANPTIESGVCWVSNSGTTSWSAIGLGESSEYDLCIRAYAVANNTYEVTFNVTDGTNALENASVTYNGTTQNTNASGQTVFLDVEEGTTAYSITKSGYDNVGGDVTVAGSNVSKDVTMVVSTYDVTFNVTDGTNALENASVTYNGATQNTNASGQTVFLEVSDGTTTYSITKSGFDNVGGDVTVAGSNVSKDVTMVVSTYDVTFNVSDGTNAIENASVTFGGSSQNTNSSGVTIFTNINIGNAQAYSIEKTGYNTINGTVDVIDQDVVENAILSETIPGTKLTDELCGITVNTTYTWIECDTVEGAEDYEFLFENSGASYSETKTTESVWGAGNGNTRIMRLYYIPNIQFGLTYNVKVRAKVNGEWGDYGSVCQYTLAVQATKLRDAECGSTVYNTSGLIYADVVVGGVEDYEFLFTNTSAGFSETRTTESVWGVGNGGRRYFRLRYIPNLQYGLTYDVQVRAKVAGVWGQYGSVCQMTLAVSATKLISDLCDGTAANTSTIIQATWASGAQDYEFWFVNEAIGFDKKRTTSSVWGEDLGARRYFRMYYMSGVQTGYVYQVRVRAKVAGVWGEFGETCSLTVGSVNKNFANNRDNDSYGIASNLKLVSYPNPFNTNTTITVNGEDDLSFDMRIFDVTGKIIIEQKMVSNKHYIVGQEFDKGIYFVVVTNNTGFSQKTKLVKIR